MFWKIIIIISEEEYSTIYSYFKKIVPNIRISKDLTIINNELLNIEIYPWRGHYHWRGHKADLIYVPREIIEDLDILSLFQINAIHGAVLPIDIIKWRIGLK